MRRLANLKFASGHGRSLKTTSLRCFLMNNAAVSRQAFSTQAVAVEAPQEIEQTETPFPYARHFSDLIQQKKSDGSYRCFRNVNRLAAEFPFAHGTREGDRVNVWCTNDYLSTGSNPEVLRVMHEVLDKYGACSGGSRNISGHNKFAVALEDTIAQLYQKPSALCFTSGYNANENTLKVLGSLLPNCVFFSDELNHSSIIAGIQHSRARKYVWKHNDVADLEYKLASVPRDVPKIICFESIYSMCGTVGPIAEVCDVAHKYGAMTFLDEVHAAGLYGPHGAGVAEHLDFDAHKQGNHHGTILSRIDLISGALGKGFGTMGGYIAGQKSLVDVIRSFSHGFIFTTALPPAVLAGARTAIDYQASHPEDRVRLQRRTASLKAELRRLGFPVVANASHIVPLMVGDAAACKSAADILYRDFAIYVQPINSPSTAVGEERLRIAPTSHHSDEHQEHLVSALKFVWEKLRLRWERDWRNAGSRLFTGEVVKEQRPLWTEEQLQAEEQRSSLATW